MGILSKALATPEGRYERGANYELGQSISASNLLGGGGDKINVVTEYTGWTWKAISTRAEYLSDEDVFIERKVGDKWQRDDTHEFNEVLSGEKVGEDFRSYDLSDLLEYHEISLNLYGESFWYFSQGERSTKPMGIYLLDPAYVTVLVSNDKISGYIYQKDGDRVLFDPKEIDYYFTKNPANKWRGTSPAQSAGIFVKSARYTTTYVNNFLEGNAIPAGVIVAKGDVSDDDWKLFKSQWTERYSGIDNSGKTGFIRGQDLDFVKTGMSLAEVDFSAMKNSSRDDILAMFSVPKALLGIFEDVNRASALALRQIFAETVTSPALKKIRRKLTKRIRQAYGEQFRVFTSNPVPEDRELTISEYKEGAGKWLTPNDIRAREGEKPIAGGDVLFLANSSSQIQEPSEEPAKKLKIKLVSKTTNKADLTYEMKESFRSEMENVQRKYEKQYLQAIEPVMKSQKATVLKQINPKKIADSGIDAKRESEKMVDATIGVLISLAKEQGQIAAEFVGNDDSDFEFTKVMERYIRDSIAKASLGFTQETEEAVSKQIQEGLEAGESLAKIAKRIDTLYEDVLGVSQPGYRIERIARTEVIKTSNQITEAAYQQSGLVKKKEWLSNPGACQFCQALDGTIIRLGASFAEKGASIEGEDGGTYINSYEDVKHPPVHPDCRCGLIPVIESK